MTFDVAEVFRIELGLAVEELESQSGFPMAEWFGSGRRSPEGDLTWWQENGPGLVQRFINWYESSDDINIWITPDGKPAIELDLTVMLGETPVRVIIDQVLKVGSALVVHDLKSGSKRPENVMQLAIGATAIEKTYGIRPKYGAFFLHRSSGEPFVPILLTGREHREEHLAHVFGMLNRAVEQGIFVPNVGNHCRRCGVAASCPALGAKP